MIGGENNGLVFWNSIGIRKENFSKVIVLNTAGQLMSVQEIEVKAGKNNQHFINVSSLAAGLYFLKYDNGHCTRTMKFIKMD